MAPFLVVAAAAAVTQEKGDVGMATRHTDLGGPAVVGCCTDLGGIEVAGCYIDPDELAVAVSRIDLDGSVAVGCCILLGPGAVGYDTGQGEQQRGYPRSRCHHPGRQWEGHGVETRVARSESMDAVEQAERAAGTSAAGLSIVALVFGLQRCAIGCPGGCRFRQYQPRHI